jgi:hypothetical protein
MMSTQLVVSPPRLEGLPEGGGACAGRDLVVALPASALRSAAAATAADDASSSSSASPSLRPVYSWRVDWIDGKALTGYDQAVTGGGPKLNFRLQPGRQIITLTLSSGGGAPLATSAAVDGLPCVECKQEAVTIGAAADACSADPAEALGLLKDAPWGVRVAFREAVGGAGAEGGAAAAATAALQSFSSPSGGPLAPGGGSRAFEVVATTPTSGVQASCVAPNVTVVDRIPPRVAAATPLPCLRPSGDRWACFRPWELVRATDNCAAQKPMAFLASCAGGTSTGDCAVARDGRACVRAAMARGAAEDKVVPVDVSVRDGSGNEAPAVRVGVIVRASEGVASAGCRTAELERPPGAAKGAAASASAVV